MEEFVDVPLNRKLTIEEMQEIAQSRGGECLSTEYINAHTKLKWRCTEDHIWRATPANIKSGKWCLKCSGLEKSTIEDMHKLAERKGGKCISTEYINNRNKLRWQCKENHIWEATPSGIKNGEHWCPKCAGVERSTIEEMRKLAEKKGGKCISEEYVNARTKLKWQCKEKHVWGAAPTDVKSGKWCPTCGIRKSADSKRGNIKEMQELAKEKGGKCLSTKYINNHTKLKWQCAEGHDPWWSRPSHVKGGRWCPICYQKYPGVSERICRKYFEIIFRENFPKTRPRWLVNNEGNLMELDGYCEKVGLAFEYHGRQHYQYVNRFHENKNDLRKRKLDDKLKKKLCEKNNVVLLEVPHTTEYEDVQEHIIKQCKVKNVKIPKITKKIDHKLFKIYSHQILKEMKKLAQTRRGECLSTEYINAHAKLLWKCQKGHSWRASPANIKGGRWCPKCGFKYSADKRRNSIEEMQKLAEKNRGNCLSGEYVNAHTKLKWQCEKGHVWGAEPTNIKSGKWCPFCAGNRKLTIEEMQKLAENRGGMCLSTGYTNIDTKLKWQCEEGHIWEAIPYNVKKGHWCPKCARLIRNKNRKD